MKNSIQYNIAAWVILILTATWAGAIGYSILSGIGDLNFLIVIPAAFGLIMSLLLFRCRNAYEECEKTQWVRFVGLDEEGLCDLEWSWGEPFKLSPDKLKGKAKENPAVWAKARQAYYAWDMAAKASLEE